MQSAASRLEPRKLPPHVRGSVSSFLDLSADISWTTVKKFSRVRLNFVWWGESEEESQGLLCETNVKTSYQVCTSDSLWLLYLKHAAPIPLQIRIYSAKTLNLIGTSKVLWDSTKGFAIVSDILGHSTRKLGEISIKFTLRPVLTTIKMPTSDKENFQVIGKSKKFTSRVRKTVFSKTTDVQPVRRLITSSLKSCVQNGCRKVLQDDHQHIVNTSDQRELVTSLAILKITIEPDTQQRIQQFIDKSQLDKFIAKCAITSDYFPDEYCLSPVFTTAPKRIAFIKPINFKANGRKSKINFGLCVKSIERTTAPLFIGFSSVTLENASIGVSHKNCPIVNEEGVGAGSMLLKIDVSFDKVDGKLKQHPSHSNDQCETGKTHDFKTDAASTNQQVHDRATNTTPEEMVESNRNDGVEVEAKKSNTLCRSLLGILFIDEIRNMRHDGVAEYFITYESFWNACLEKTEICANGLFNYLKQFAVTCDESFLNQVQNNHLELKLWEKTQYSEKLVGTTLIPLHQFFIGFHDNAMIEHLSKNPLPVISFDSWANFLTPLSNELLCEIKILIAIGSESQISYLKVLRNLDNSNRHRALDISHRDGGSSMQTNGSQSCLKNKLSAFIASLSKKLPESGDQPANNLHKLLPTHSASSEEPKATQFGRTSDLLDSLQKALLEPPPTPSFRPLVQSSDSVPSSEDSSMSQEKIKTRVNIDFATNLKKIFKKRQNRKKMKGSSTTQKIEFEPAVYATFESVIEKAHGSLPKTIVKSHEGLVNCTSVVKGCEPHWNQTFDVLLSLDMFQNPQKKFIVKIWRKVAQDSEMTPTPFVDAVVGFCAIDLSVLMTGLPVLSGYYNIVDFAGKVNGQIKLSLSPLETLSQSHQNFLFHESIPSRKSIADDDEPNLLSRTLKRKFTELDEITQRLKARLQDVTADENFASEDEFERDLNTCAENEGIASCTQDFAWLNDSNGNLFNDQPSTSKAMNPATASHLQKEVLDSPLAIDMLLKKYDLDTIINPNIFKNIVDPSLATSDSTPTLNQHFQKDFGCGDTQTSCNTSLSDDLSNDQMQTTMLQMQTALQKATLTENSSEPSSRKDPDGENNISE